MANTQGGRVTWVIDADNKSFKSTLADSERAASATAAEIQRSSSRLASDLGNTFGSIGRILSGGLTAGANVAAGALISLGIKGIQTGSYMQSLQLQMNGLTKSVELGARAMSIAKDYWEANPFQRVDVAAATKTLLAFGGSVNDLADNLKILGNVSITSGVPLQSLASIFGQVAAQGRLMGGDIVQLTQNGVAILPALQKMLGKTADEVRDMASEGKISFGQFKTAMESLVDPNIVKQMENTIPRQLDRLSGAVTNISFAFVGAITDAKVGVIAQGDGLLQAVTNLVRSIADTLKLEKVTEAIARAGLVFAPLVNYVTSLFTVIDGHSKVGDFLIGFFDVIAKLGPVLIPIIALMALKFSSLFGQIPVVGELLGGLSGAVSGLTSSLGGLAGSSADVALKSIGTVISGIPGAIETTLGSFDKLKTAVAAISSPFKQIVNDFQSGFNDSKAAASAFTGVVGTIGGFFDRQTPTLQGFSSNVSKIFDTAKNSVGNFVSTQTPTLQKWSSNVGIFVDSVKQNFSGLSSVLKSVSGSISNGLSGAFNIVGGAVSKLGSIVGSVASSIAGPLFNGIVAIGVAAATMGSKFGETLNGIINNIVSNGPKMVSAFADNIKLLSETIVSNLPQLMTAFQTIITTIVNFIITSGPSLIQSFTNIIVTLINSVASPSNITLIVQSIVTLFSSMVSSLSQVLPVILNAVLLFIQEMILQFTKPDVLDSLITNVVTMMSSMVKSLAQALPIIIKGLVDFLIAFIDVITRPDILDMLIDATILLIITITTALLDNLPKIIDAGIRLISALVQAFTKPETLNKIGGAILQIGQKIIDTIVGIDWLKLGGDIVRGIWNGISNLGAWIGQKIKGFGESVMKNLKDFFGIKSPSRLMRDEIGKNLGLGIALGITNSAKSAVKAATTAAGQISSAFTPIADTTISGDYSVRGTMAPIGMSDFEGSSSTATGNKIEIQQNNTINTDVDMDKVTRDLTWELSRA